MASNQSGGRGKRLVYAVLAVALAWPLASLAADAKAPALGVTGGAAVNYQCGKLKKVVARYYDLSDGSLGFVKLTINGEEFTLAQGMAASGVRYVNEMSYEWWTKGNEASLQDLRQKKAANIVCKEIPAKP